MDDQGRKPPRIHQRHVALGFLGRRYDLSIFRHGHNGIIQVHGSGPSASRRRVLAEAMLLDILVLTLWGPGLVRVWSAHAVTFASVFCAALALLGLACPHVLWWRRWRAARAEDPQEGVPHERS